MKIRHRQSFTDYRKALETWRSTTPSTIHSNTDGTYTVEWVVTCNGDADLMREYLVDIKIHNDLPQEQLDALAFADSAIKTLVDIGVIE